MNEKFYDLSKIIPFGLYDHLDGNTVREPRLGAFSIQGELGLKFQFWMILRAA